MSVRKGVPPTGSSSSQGPENKSLGIAAGALVNTNTVRPTTKGIILGVMAGSNPSGRAGVTPAVDRPSVRTVSPPSLQAKPASTVTDVVDTLRNGGALDAASMAVIADGINASFEKLRSAWGGKLYFSPAEVRLFDDRDPDNPDPDDYTVTYLAFKKQDKGWNFVLEEVYGHDSEGESTMSPLASAPLDVRLQAIEALPELEEKLKKERDALARALVDAYDSLTSFVEKSAKTDKETNNGTA
jgi:hypothetical protein